MTAEEDRSIRSNDFEHDAINLAAAGSVTFNMGSGTDTSTNRYLNLSQGLSYGIEVIPTVACSITKINGKTLKSSISVPINGYKATQGKFTNITIQAGTATVVQIGGKC